MNGYADFMFLFPAWLWALLPLAGLLIWLFYHPHRPSLVAPHLAQAMGLTHKKHQHLWLAGVSFCWLIATLALAGPSFEKRPRPSYTNSAARVVVMDMSLSLYASDLTPNRLSQARYKVLDLLSGWQEGNTGLVAYAGDAYSISPLTTDTATIASLLPNLSPEIMPFPGANAAAGVQLAIDMLRQANVASGDIILIADDISMQESQSIQTLLSGTPWRFILLGIGTTNGSPIRLSDGALLRDDQQQTVIAKTDFIAMQKLASQVGGHFVAYRNDDQDVHTILRLTETATSNIEQQTGTPLISDAINHGYWLVILLIIPTLLLFRRGVLLGLFITMSMFTTSQPVQASAWLNQDQQAWRAYQQGEYESAATLFSSSEWQGVARYQAGDYQGAIDSWESIPTPSEKIQYNLANAYAQAGQLEKAKQGYQEILNNNPNHQDAQHNLAEVEQALKQQQQQQQQQQHQQQQQQQQESSSETEQGQASSSSLDDQDNETNQTTVQPDSLSPTESDGSLPSQMPLNEKTKADQPDEGKKDAENDEEVKNQPDNLAPSDVEHTASQSGQNENSTQEVDPQMRRLEQVENARDPSRLLRAQLYLQAKNKPTPSTEGKKW
ncbi:VWA domain-containing protein [Vibrio cincinnatiensis]